MKEVRGFVVPVKDELVALRDGAGVTSSDVARELLCLFTESFERADAQGKRFRSGHRALLSSIALTPLKPG